MTYSFDIFDTVLTRVVANPEDIFQLTGKDAVEKGLWTKSIEDFKTIRMAAEVKSRIGKENSETTFEEIYQTFNELTKLDKNIINQISALEIAREEWAIRPVGIMKEQIEKARKKTKKGILFLTDMYLPSLFLKMILIHFGYFEENDLIIVSCEQKAAKHNGTLYKKIKHDLQITDKWIHFGNNYNSDFVLAKQEGIEAIYFEQGNLNRYELILTESNNIDYSLFAGISRITRLKKKYNSRKEKIIFNTTANVVAPCMISYTIWCLQKAKEQNIETLYFASRDGEVLLEIARILAPNLYSTCELQYLYGGRHVWYNALLADFEEYPEGILMFLFSKDPTLKKVINRFNINTNDILAVLNEYGFKENQLNKQIIDQKKFLSLLNDQRVKKIIKLKNKQHAELSKEYLEQNSFFKNKRKAIVDLGWFGNVLNSLNEFLHKHEGEKIKGFYWGLARENYDNYTYTNEATRHYWQLEMFCSGSHGAVLGFERFDNEIKIILKENTNDKVIKWGLYYLRDAIYLFTKEMKDIISEINHLDYKYFAKTIDEFTKNPSKEEATYWGDFPYEEDQQGELVRPIAPKLNISELFDLIRKGIYINNKKYEWTEARIARNNITVNYILFIRTQFIKLTYLIRNKLKK